MDKYKEKEKEKMKNGKKKNIKKNNKAVNRIKSLYIITDNRRREFRPSRRKVFTKERRFFVLTCFVQRTTKYEIKKDKILNTIASI